MFYSENDESLAFSPSSCSERLITNGSTLPPVNSFHKLTQFFLYLNVSFFFKSAKFFITLRDLRILFSPVVLLLLLCYVNYKEKVGIHNS